MTQMPLRRWAAVFFALAGLALILFAWRAEIVSDRTQANDRYDKTVKEAMKWAQQNKDYDALSASRDPKLEKMDGPSRAKFFKLAQNSPDKKLRDAYELEKRFLTVLWEISKTRESILHLPKYDLERSALNKTFKLRNSLYHAAMAAAAAILAIWIFLIFSGRQPLPAAPAGYGRAARYWYLSWRSLWAAFWAWAPLLLGISWARGLSDDLMGDCHAVFFGLGHAYRSSSSGDIKSLYYAGLAVIIAAAFLPRRTTRLFPAPGQAAALGWPWTKLREKWRRKMSAEELIHLGGYLASALKQGLPLPESIKAYADSMSGAWLQGLFTSVASRLESGRSLSQALAASPEYFPRTFIAIVQAGEAQEDLPRALETAGRSLAKEARLQASFDWLLHYILIFSALALSFGWFLLTFVVPTFAAITASFGGELPWITMFFFDIGACLNRYSMLFIAAGLLAVIYRFYSGVRFTELAFSRLPPVRRIRRKIREAHFCRTLAELLLSGCPLGKALELCRGLDAAAEFQDAVGRTLSEVAKGNRLSGALASSPAFSPRLAWACALGEERGNLPETLLWLGDHDELWIRARLDFLRPLLERSATIAMGLLVGVFVVALFMPIFSISSLSSNFP